ncbi:uncharacterized protein lrif1 [Plectropomus leopardus]|uniref:uncharacterized protein lrif1 n=1 Tax=Plectropomus leopardus TaxID=160734 RepID=UPI001C4BD5BE|nr:uncharacterized protein lrif1 [Plectropomus leopardus]
MKLIPVQMVSRQFVSSQMIQPKMNPTPQKPVAINTAPAPVRAQISHPKTNPTPQKALAIQMALAPVQSQTIHPKTNPTAQKAVTIKTVPAPVKMSALNPSTTQQIVNKQVSLTNAFPNQAGWSRGQSLNKHPLQQQDVNLMAVVPLAVTPATNSGTLGRLPGHLPVTVKFPALPRGPYLQIPSSSQVPASERPHCINQPTFTPLSSSSSPSLSSLLCVSPTTTVSPNTAPQSDSALCETSNITSCPSKGSKPHLKLIPKASQRPNSPIKWVIEEEEDSSATPAPDPLHSSVTSEALRAVAERGNASQHCDVLPKPVPLWRRGKSGQGKEDALITDNGKVFFVAKNCSLRSKMAAEESPTATRKSHELDKTVVSSPKQSLESAAPQMKQSLRVPHESDEVIDLCDDDASDDSSQQAASAQVSALTLPDEDNVIFVSYIPPKAESASTPDLRPQTQMTHVKETDQTGATCSDEVTEQQSRNAPADDDISAVRSEPDQSMSYHTVRNLPHVCDSPLINMYDNEGSNTSSQQSASSHQPENMKADAESRRPADPSTSNSSSGKFSPIEMDTYKVESSMYPAASWTSSPESCQRADSLLRQLFGITANVEVSLQRIDGASDWCPPADPLQSESISSEQDQQEPASGLKEKDILQDLCCPQDMDKRVKVSEQELSENQSPHTDNRPFKCSHFKVNTKALSVLKKKCLSGNSPLRGTSCVVETEPVIGYMEPIDEDFLSTDEKDIPNSQDTSVRPQTQTCPDLNTNTRRLGRTRKRTMCPCCIPGAQDAAAKSSTKTQEPDRWTWRTERTNKRGGRAKTLRKDVKTSGSISCPTEKRRHYCRTPDEVSASVDSLSTVSVDCEELEKQEQVRRLRELLAEKEAALELIRKGLS